MDFAKAIRLARARTKMQQSELAEATGLHKSYISLLESGKRIPSTETLERLARALDIPSSLFHLLGAEAEDLRAWDPESVNAFAQDLLALFARKANP